MSNEQQARNETETTSELGRVDPEGKKGGDKKSSNRPTERVRLDRKVNGKEMKRIKRMKR